MKKILPDEGFYFMMLSLETEGIWAHQCHLQLHLGLDMVLASFDLHENQIYLEQLLGRKKNKEGRREGKRKEVEEKNCNHYKMLFKLL